MLQYSCLWSVQDSLNESPPGVTAIIILEELFLKIIRMKSRIREVGTPPMKRHRCSDAHERTYFEVKVPVLVHTFLKKKVHVAHLRAYLRIYCPLTTH